MKLPTFQAQQGTSMASAMTTPAQMGQIQKRIPVTKRLEGTRSVQGELNLGLQKSRAYQQMGQSVMKLASVTMQIKEADETMAANAAVGEYNNRMAQWTTNAKITANELNEDTGLRRWETFDDDLKNESDALKAELRDKYKFSMQKAEQTWSLKTGAMDSTYTNDAAIFTNKKTVERAGATYQVAMSGATTIGEAVKLTGDAVNSGIIDEGTGISNIDKWQTGKIYDQAVTTIPAMGLEQLQNTAQGAVTGDKQYAKLTIPQRNSIATEALKQTKALHVGLIDEAYRGGGISGAAQYLEKISAGGTDASYAIDDLDHKSIIATAGERLNQLAAIEKANYVEQTSGVMLAPLFTKGDNSAELDILAMTIGTAEGKTALKGMDAELANVANEPDFLDRTFSLSAKLGHVGAESKTINGYLDHKMRTGTPSEIVDSINYMNTIEQQYPTAFKSIPQSTRDRADYIKYEMEIGNIDPSDTASIDRINRQYIDVQNMGPGEKQDRNQQATSHISAIEAEDGMTAYITSLAVKAGDIAEGEELAQTTQSQTYFKQRYKESFKFTQNPEFSGERAYKEYRRQVGVVNTADGTSAEYNPPELLVPKGPLTEPEHREYIDKEKQNVIAEFNISKREEDQNWNAITTEDVNFVYNGKNKAGKYVWTVTDLGNVAIPYKDGNLQVTIDGYTQKESPEKIQISNDNESDKYTNRQEQIASKANIRLIDNGIKNFDPGGAGRNVKANSELYEFAWMGMPDKDRADATTQYRAMYNTLKSANNIAQVNDDAMIHWYLFSQGYLQDDGTGNWKRPPGMINAD